MLPKMARVLKVAAASAAGLFPRLRTPVSTVRTSASLSSHPGAGPVWNLGRLNHVAVAVPDLEKARAFYKNVLGAEVGEPVPLPEHGVSVVFVNLGNTKMELLHPLGSDSPIAGFLKKNKAGGMHHVCIESMGLSRVFSSIQVRMHQFFSIQPSLWSNSHVCT
uniref:Methylmalonyl-CoA epimerase n=1 Tax=Bos taurus TaxID=9913 RepID=A0AAA9T0X7_BOVIN